MGWKDPIGSVRRAVDKLVVGPLRYGRGADYDASRYWSDRFSRYGFSLRGAGHDGLSEEDNARMYDDARAIFVEACRGLGRPLESARVLEIGVGAGYWTATLRSLGVQSYVGVDIADVLFPELERKHPGFEFRRCDVTAEPLAGSFDLVVMIDVIQHIVTRSRLEAALASVGGAVAPGGHFLVSPIAPWSIRRLFYFHSWTLDDVMGSFHDWEQQGLAGFRDGRLLTLRRPG